MSTSPHAKEDDSSPGKPAKSTPQIGRLLVWPLLSLPLLWLFVGIVLYILGNISNWQQVFLLRDYPVISVVLLVVLVIVYFLGAKGWGTRFVWPRAGWILLAILGGTLGFYVSLLVVVALIPYITGYSFKTDTSVLIAAAIPLVALLAFFIMQTATSLRVKVGNVEIDLDRTLTKQTEEDQIFRLKSSEAQTDHASISRAARILKSEKGKARTLIIRFTKGGKGLPFEALRDYIYDLSKQTPLQNIVFIDEGGHYLGFTTAEGFKERFPLFGFESLLKDIDDDDPLQLQSPTVREARAVLWQRLSGVFGPQIWSLRSSLVQGQWEATGQWQDDLARFVIPSDMLRLGAERGALRKEATPEANRQTILEAYSQMVRDNLPAVPLVDRDGMFLGMIDKDKVIEELLSQPLQQKVQ